MNISLHVFSIAAAATAATAATAVGNISPLIAGSTTHVQHILLAHFAFKENDAR